MKIINRTNKNARGVTHLRVNFSLRLILHKTKGSFRTRTSSERARIWQQLMREWNEQTILRGNGERCQLKRRKRVNSVYIPRGREQQAISNGAHLFTLYPHPRLKKKKKKEYIFFSLLELPPVDFLFRSGCYFSSCYKSFLFYFLLLF